MRKIDLAKSVLAEAEPEPFTLANLTTKSLTDCSDIPVSGGVPAMRGVYSPAPPPDTLVQNAADHAKGDEPVCLCVRAEPSSWRFEVADDGGGLPPGDERAVFEPFNTRSSRRGGMGLGLAIVQGIARAHGGESGVVNRPGRGATFWIRIPR